MNVVPASADETTPTVPPWAFTGEVVSGPAKAYTAAMQWTRAGRDQWICRLPPDARYTLKVFVKGDGRWSWEVFAGAALSPMATGIAGNVGAAKKTAEQFVTRSGYA